MGSKKPGKVGGGGMNTNGTAALAQKRRGRPPKDKNQSEAGYDESPTPHIKPIENENSGELLLPHLKLVLFWYPWLCAESEAVQKLMVFDSSLSQFVGAYLVLLSG